MATATAVALSKAKDTKPMPRGHEPVTPSWVGRVPQLKPGNYADGMPIHSPEYICCKLILRPNKFHSRESFFDFGKVFKVTAIAPVRHSERYAPLFVVGGVVAIAALVFSRSPNVVFTARFFAEDGAVFYQQVHEYGFLHSVFMPYAGYLHLYPRLIAKLSLWLPLFYVPLFFNVTALVVQCMAAAYLCSPRLRNLGALPVRVIAAFLYLGLPHIEEVWGKLQDSQWHIAVLSFLILIAMPPRNRIGRYFDVVALSIGALTGPFSILLLPIALIVAIYRRSLRTIVQAGIVGAGAVVQSIVLLAASRTSEYANLGASFPLFCKLMIRCLVLGVLSPPSAAHRILESPHFWLFGMPLLLLASVSIGWIFWKGSLEVRCLLLFAAAVTAASLVSPVALKGKEQWPMMLTGWGDRYWFIPRVALAITVLWVAAQPFPRYARRAAMVALVAILICCLAGWHLLPSWGIHFPTYVHLFNALPVGSELQIPVEPPGWTVRLTKWPFDRTSHDPGFADGQVLGIDAFRDQFRLALPGSDPADLTGEILLINGADVHGRGSITIPIHVAVRDGVLLEGWADLATDGGTLPVDEIYAMLPDGIVPGVRLPFAVIYKNVRLQNVAYLVFLPSELLRPGLQRVTLLGYLRSDNRLHSYREPLYIYGK